jgi:exodeoxyribonuclease VII small subunit
MSKKKTKDDTAAPAPDFESAVEDLEEIIEQIESGEVGLEQCLSQYERGMMLIAHCRSILDKAEKRMAELTTDAKGNLRVEGEQD